MSKKLIYENPINMLKDIHGVLVLDLLKYSLLLEQDPLLDGLLDAPEGIYVQGNMEPIATLDNDLYPRSKYMDGNSIFTNIKDILACKEDVVDADNNTILSRRHILKFPKSFSTEPTIPVMAIKVAISLVTSYLHNLCPYTRISINKPNYRLENLVRESHYYLLEENAYEVAYDELMLEVMNFVDNDVWNIYFTKMVGTALVIEKSIDYRIYDWYRIKYREQQEEETSAFFIADDVYYN